jgi:hypothetical protein
MTGSCVVRRLVRFNYILVLFHCINVFKNLPTLMNTQHICPENVSR